MKLIAATVLFAAVAGTGLAAVRLVEDPLPGTNSGPVMNGDACEFDFFLGQTVCTTSPYSVVPRELGALTFFSVDPSESYWTWSPEGFLRAFQFSFPNVCTNLYLR